MSSFNEFEFHIVGKDVRNDKDIMTSDALAYRELAFTCLESYEFCVKNIVVTCIAGIVCISVLGS